MDHHPRLALRLHRRTLFFWEALGFTVTYRQDSPYQYGVFERGGYELHFGRVKGMDPANSHSGCL